MVIHYEMAKLAPELPIWSPVSGHEPGGVMIYFADERLQVLPP